MLRTMTQPSGVISARQSVLMKTKITVRILHSMVGYVVMKMKYALVRFIVRLIIRELLGNFNIWYALMRPHVRANT